MGEGGNEGEGITRSLVERRNGAMKRFPQCQGARGWTEGIKSHDDGRQRVKAEITANPAFNFSVAGGSPGSLVNCDRRFRLQAGGITRIVHGGTYLFIWENEIRTTKIIIVRWMNKKKKSP